MPKLIKHPVLIRDGRSQYIYILNKQQMEPATKEVLLVSFHFMILFTAFNAFQTIVTRINEEEGDYTLGPFRFAINYSVFMVANLFAPQVKYSEKWQITFATLTYVFQYLTGLLMSGTSEPIKFISAALGATVNGIGASFLWTSVGSYIHKVCHHHDKIKVKGYYFGIFNTIFCASSILGAVVVTFGLTLFSHTVYFLIVSGVALLAFFFGLFFIKDIKSRQGEGVQEQVKKQSALQFAMKAAKSQIKFYPIMKHALGLIVLDGINLGVVTCTMLHLTPKTKDKTQNNLNAGLCLIMYGVGCVLGGFLGGKITDRIRIKLSSTGYIYVYCMCCLYTIMASEVMEMWSAMTSCFLWGFVLYSNTALLMVICSRLYEGKPETFALVKQFHCFAFVIYEVVSLSTNNSIPIPYIMFVLLGFGIPAMWGACLSPVQKKTEVESEVAENEEQNGQSSANLHEQLATRTG